MTPASFIGQGEGGLGGNARLSQDSGLHVTSASASCELQHPKPLLEIIKRAKYSQINILPAFPANSEQYYAKYTFWSTMLQCVEWQHTGKQEMDYLESASFYETFGAMM